jgi:hypothetical protein
MESDAGIVRSELVAGLPEGARWTIRGVPLDFDYSDARRGLRKPTADEVPEGDEPDWPDLLVFGRYDYAEGGGAAPWIAVRIADGAVCGLDVEREDPYFLFNSSVERFIKTFALLDQYLRRGQALPADIEGRVRSIDPEAYLGSEWRFLIEHLTGS